MITTLNCNGIALDLSQPIIMGILNVTPDSFYDGGRYWEVDAAVRQAREMMAQGATIIDVGGASSRPGAPLVETEEEIRRVVPVIAAIKHRYPDAIVSIDTWRGAVAKAAVQAGASIINDISAGNMDPDMFPTVAELNVPYILMHIKGTPENMQQNPDYQDITTEVLDFLIQKTAELRALGVKDIIIDPGFGFGKTIRHNYTLLNRIQEIKSVLQVPLLVGVSRKSMIYRLLDISPENALNGATALHVIALQQGANILRVHDVKEAVEVLKLMQEVNAAAE